MLVHEASRNNNDNQFALEELATPIGSILVVTGASGAVLFIEWGERLESLQRVMLRRHGVIAEANIGMARSSACRLLNAYFEGDCEALASINVEATGTTFQTEVWRQLRNIPAGTTISYRELATRIGKPSATRAVGLANGSNPIPIVVPCHRVIGSNGSLTGFGGGLERKKWLLAHEKCLAV